MSEASERHFPKKCLASSPLPFTVNQSRDTVDKATRGNSVLSQSSKCFVETQKISPSVRLPDKNQTETMLQTSAEVHATPTNINKELSVCNAEMGPTQIHSSVPATCRQENVYNNRVCSPQGKLVCFGDIMNSESVYRNSLNTSNKAIVSEKTSSYSVKKTFISTPGKSLAELPPLDSETCVVQNTVTDNSFVEVVSTKYHCTQCKFVTGNKTAIMDHRTIHDKSQTVSCVACNFVFESMNSLKIWHQMNDIRHDDLTDGDSEAGRSCHVRSRVKSLFKHSSNSNEVSSQKNNIFRNSLSPIMIIDKPEHAIREVGDGLELVEEDIDKHEDSEDESIINPVQNHVLKFSQGREGSKNGSKRNYSERLYDSMEGKTTVRDKVLKAKSHELTTVPQDVNKLKEERKFLSEKGKQPALKRKRSLNGQQDVRAKMSGVSTIFNDRFRAQENKLDQSSGHDQPNHYAHKTPAVVVYPLVQRLESFGSRLYDPVNGVVEGYEIKETQQGVYRKLTTDTKNNKNCGFDVLEKLPKSNFRKRIARRRRGRHFWTSSKVRAQSRRNKMKKTRTEAGFAWNRWSEHRDKKSRCQAGPSDAGDQRPESNNQTSSHQAGGSQEAGTYNGNQTGTNSSNKMNRTDKNGGEEDGDENNNDDDESLGKSSDGNSELYLCIICQTGYAQKSALMKHLKVIHHLPNLCQICYFNGDPIKRFANPVSLRNHKVRQHPEEMVQCVCGAMFIDEKMLSTHLKKFKCNAKQSGELESDMIRCICGKRFGSVDLIKIHQAKCRKRSLEDEDENIDAGELADIDELDGNNNVGRGTTQQDMDPKISKRLQAKRTCKTKIKNYSEDNLNLTTLDQKRLTLSSSAYVADSKHRQSAGKSQTRMPELFIQPSDLNQNLRSTTSGYDENETFENTEKDMPRLSKCVIPKRSKQVTKRSSLDTASSTSQIENTGPYDINNNRYQVEQSGVAVPQKRKRKGFQPNANSIAGEDGRYPCKICGKRYKKPYLYSHQIHAHAEKQWTQIPLTKQGR